MKITYLSSPISSQYGGGEKFLDDFTTGIEAEHEFIGSSKAVYNLFQSKGYKATLASGLFEPVSPRNVLLIPVSTLVGLFQFIRFYNTFKDSDWIISPTSHCEIFFVIPWIKLILRKNALFMVHAPKVPKLFSIPPLNWVLSKCWGNSPVVFVSNSQKELWVNAGCVSSNQIVIYNGVKVNEFDTSCGGQIPLVRGGSEADEVFAEEVLEPPDRIFRSAQDDEETLKDSESKVIKIGFLARLHKEKRCDVLINSLKYIRSEKDIEIKIAGDGPEKENLTRLLNESKLPTNIKVEFIGFQSDIKTFYETIDLLVFPSLRESFGLVICEAMERGVSVLCSNLPSSLEVKKIIDLTAESDLIFQMDNPQDLASKIDYFIDSKNQYLDMKYKQKLHSVVVENFSSETMIDQYKKVLT
jgi:glycosyltransferase involved in cell wall biosynthesis